MAWYFQKEYTVIQMSAKTEDQAWLKFSEQYFGELKNPRWMYSIDEIEQQDENAKSLGLKKFKILPLVRVSHSDLAVLVSVVDAMRHAAKSEHSSTVKQALSGVLEEWFECQFRLVPIKAEDIYHECHWLKGLISNNVHQDFKVTLGRCRVAKFMLGESGKNAKPGRRCWAKVTIPPDQIHKPFIPEFTPGIVREVSREFLKVKFQGDTQLREVFNTYIELEPE